MARGPDLADGVFQRSTAPDVEHGGVLAAGGATPDTALFDRLSAQIHTMATTQAMTSSLHVRTNAASIMHSPWLRLQLCR